MQSLTNKDTMVMKLLHYFITERNYNPVVLQGAKDEIWLENQDGEYKIVRIVSNYIHNNEQLNFDIFKTKRIVKSIRKKTFNVNMNVLSIFVDLGDNVSLENEKNIDFVSLNDEGDVKNYDFLCEAFPDIDKKLVFDEKGVNLFLKITEDINKKNIEQAHMVDEIFRPKKPIVTYILIAINVLVFLFCTVFNLSDMFVDSFANYYPYVVKHGEYYRLITSVFLHVNLLHIAFNMYALYLLGREAESFFGKWRFLLIYLVSGVSGSLLSILMNADSASIGASGAIFGIMGALLYFGYNFRAYLGNTLVRELVPVVIINLLFGFAMPGIDNFAHIGGLVLGVTSAMAVGIRGKSSTSNRINGLVMSLIIIGFLIFMNFFYTRV